MIPSRSGIWMPAVVAWFGFIFFTSSSLAQQIANNLYFRVAHLFSRSLTPKTSSQGMIHLLVDKAFHVSIFVVLALLLWQALSLPRNKAWIILAIGAVTGTCSEILQGFFPDRDPTVRDVLINTGGTALGLGLRWLFAGRAKVRKPLWSDSALAESVESEHIYS